MGSCLNVINSQAANYSNYSNKYGTKRYCYGIKLRSQISAAFFEKKVNKRRGANSRKFGTFPYAL